MTMRQPTGVRPPKQKDPQTHIGSTPIAYSSDDERGLCCWDTYDVTNKGHFSKVGKCIYQIHRNKSSKLGKTRQQRNMFEMKEQDKISEELSEVETGNLPEKELKVMIVKMIKELNG